MQQPLRGSETLAAAAGQPRTALPPQTPVASVAAGHIFPPAAAAAGAPAAAALRATCTGLTTLERRTALYMLNLLGKSKDAGPFRAPVDWKAEGIPDYPDVIKHPMDFKTAREKVRAGVYRSMDEWRADMKLIWDNCRKYNGENHPLAFSAKKMEAVMERRMEEAVAEAARELSLAQRAAAGGLAGKGAADGAKRKAPAQAALARASSTPAGSDSDGAEDGRQAGPALQTAVRQQQQPLPEPMRRPSSVWPQASTCRQQAQQQKQGCQQQGQQQQQQLTA
ncbi:Bromodomain-containing protein [Scenedesmus sp. NREL 46B-D3]|nr:Bromodomain-containing protein [Scenedesmus sp. NREL 46B-D3]